MVWDSHPQHTNMKVRPQFHSSSWLQDVRFRVRLTLNFICRQRWNLCIAQARQITDEEKEEEGQHKWTRRKAKDPTSSGPFGNENSSFQELYMEPEWTPISQANCNSAAILLSSRKCWIRFEEGWLNVDYVQSRRQRGWRVPSSTRILFNQKSK